MIEVEKKFIIPPDSFETLTEGAEFISEKRIKDEYFDNPEWTLSQQGTFLRKRDGVWELKVNRNEGPFGVRHFDEITDPEQIAEHLNLPADGPLGARLKASGYKPFAAYETVRKKYHRYGFTIDIDHAEYANGDAYDVVEIELTGEDFDSAEARINEYAESLGLPDHHVTGKLQYYCERHVPEQYAVMLKHGHAA